MFSLDPAKYKIDTLHVGGDGNIYRVREHEGKRFWYPEEKRDLTKLFSEALAPGNTLSAVERINLLTVQNDEIGVNFFGSCQYYSAWQVYYLFRLSQHYELDSSKLGFSFELGTPATPDEVAESIASWRANEATLSRSEFAMNHVRAVIDNKWNIFFDFPHSKWFCPREEQDACHDHIWLPVKIKELPKADRKEVRKFLKAREKRVIEWLTNVNWTEIETDVGDFMIMHPIVPQNVVDRIHQRLGSGIETLDLPHYRRSDKEDAKWDKLVRKGKRRKAERKYGYDHSRIAWDRLWPDILEPASHQTAFRVPVDGVSTEVKKAHQGRLNKKMDKQQAKIDAVTNVEEWLLYLMRHSNMWMSIPKIFRAMFPNAQIQTPRSLSPKDMGVPRLLNDWSNNYTIGLMCALLHHEGHIKRDEYFECANT